MSKISFISSDKRFYNISRCLSLIKSEITSKIGSNGFVAIKICANHPNNPSHSTHPESLAAVLEFIKPLTPKQIVVCENTKNHDIINIFKSYGYLDLQDDYDFAVCNLSKDETDNLYPANNQKKRQNSYKIPKTILDADCLINLSQSSTASHVPVCGAIENFLTITENKTNKIAGKLFAFKKAPIAKTNEIYSDLGPLLSYFSNTISVIDGFETLQGGVDFDSRDTIQTSWALASGDALACDWLMSRLLSVDIDTVPYLAHNADIIDMSNNLIVGDNWQSHIHKIQLHQNFEKSR